MWTVVGKLRASNDLKAGDLVIEMNHTYEGLLYCEVGVAHRYQYA